MAVGPQEVTGYFESNSSAGREKKAEEEAEQEEEEEVEDGESSRMFRRWAS